MRAEFFLIVFGRILLSLLFILSALSKIGAWGPLVEQLAAKGIPYAPFFLGAALVIELIGGLTLLLGWQARLSAWLLFVYLIPTTGIMHNFWAYTGEEQQVQLVNFLKNLAIMGGLLLVPSSTEQRVIAGREQPERLPERPPQTRAA
jgi:putative oxidoreductase